MITIYFFILKGRCADKILTHKLLISHREHHEHCQTSPSYRVNKKFASDNSHCFSAHLVKSL